MQEHIQHSPLIARSIDKDWQSIYSQSTLTVGDLLTQLGLDAHPLATQQTLDFPLRAPQPYLDKIKPNSPNDPLLLQVLPQTREFEQVDGFTAEPLLEQDYSPVPGLIHKYQSRVLLVLTQACAIHCRYCFRRNFPYSEHQQSRKQWDKALAYILENKQINEVILSGGDPLSLPDKYLSDLLHRIDSIAHIKRIRIHTRMLPSLPQRISDPFIEILKTLNSNIVFVAHCNHENELGDDTAIAFRKLKAVGVTLLNQSVLLKDINDNAGILQNLSEKLFDQGVLPYYLFTLDKVDGAAHFDLSREKAKEIYKQLSSLLPGFLLPKLAEECPGETSKSILTW
ncbi:hypothetical protein A3715_00710 [Oleiphilus sp. HI0009]|nr:MULTISPECIES: EF-P beta-lysylation protein EpmB [unclassified Oleiphilus]KZX77679.1 hypothetical protein A3715_20865 [Oleiphilus sp. HI0009]KZX82307.1 hypothetical protein A3715_00710 [Oleiphilus sp. HI0009]KZY66672.1 hypothetical protein A3738_05760 [Oleiphilus sp. HI0066]KZY73131.1 hypothetical protein A3739_03100 [Oleiphilus sp. HI0067]